jgi:hypothetical protein
VTATVPFAGGAAVEVEVVRPMTVTFAGGAAVVEVERP